MGNIEIFKKILANAFNISDDQASVEDIRERIESGAAIKGTNMCVLILAIFVASVGLNMNSTAVIIGAMLISPLMGSIMAMGFGLATNDMDLFKRSAMGLALQVIVSLVTSTVYFKLSPISTASSEILARTNPTAWDVIIACAGGLAGIIGTTRKEKSNIIPGVAIATALMPPLCTAGFGLANADWSYFLGALYLFFINSFFICISTVIVVKIMRYPTKKFIDAKSRNKVKRNIIVIGIIMVIPSIYLGYQIVDDSMLESNVNKFIASEFNFDNTQVVQTNIDTENGELEVALIGKTLDENTINHLKDELSNYHLSNITLKVTQTQIDTGITMDDVENLLSNTVTNTNSAMNAANSSIEQLQSEVLSYKTQLLEYQSRDIDTRTLNEEISTLYPEITNFTIGYMNMWNNVNETNETVLTMVVYADNPIESARLNTLKSWIKAKSDVNNINVITQYVHDATSETDTSDITNTTSDDDVTNGNETSN